MPITPTDHALAGRLRKVLAGEVFFDRFSRGRYAADASHYQIEPVGVVVPRTQEDIVAAMAIAREEGVPVLPRGGATSQSGQTVGRALVLDFSKYLNRLVAVDQAAASCVVEPGIVLDELNRQLKPTGLWFPVDVSTASRATIGGMAGNNSCGTRSIRYGIMRDNVLAIDAILADGSQVRFGEVGHNLAPTARVWPDGKGALGEGGANANAVGLVRQPFARTCRRTVFVVCATTVSCPRPSRSSSLGANRANGAPRIARRPGRNRVRLLPQRRVSARKKGTEGARCP